MVTRRSTESALPLDPSAPRQDGASNGSRHSPPPTLTTNLTEQDRAVLAMKTAQPEVEQYATHRFNIANEALRLLAAARQNAATRFGQLEQLTFEVLFAELKGLDPFIVGSARALPRGFSLFLALLLVSIFLGAITAEVNNQFAYAVQELQDPWAAFSVSILAFFIAVFWHLVGCTVSERSRRWGRYVILGVGSLSALFYLADLALLIGPARKPLGIHPDSLRTGLILLQSFFVPCLCSVILEVLARLFPIVKTVADDPEHQARSTAAKTSAVQIAKAEGDIAAAQTTTVPFDDHKAVTIDRFVAVWRADRAAADAEARKMDTLLGR